MKRLLVALLFATSLEAAEIEAGAAHVIAFPRDDGTLDIETSRGFGAHAEIFWRDTVSTRVAAMFVNPAAILRPESPPPADVDLGTLGLDIYSVAARWHFAPHARLSAFAGAGGALVVIGNLDDQFGDEVEIEFDPELAPMAEGGVRYRVHPRIVFEAAVAYIPLEPESQIRGARQPRYPLPDAVQVDPIVVSVGAAWRF